MDCITNTPKATAVFFGIARQVECLGNQFVTGSRLIGIRVQFFDGQAAIEFSWIFVCFVVKKFRMSAVAKEEASGKG